MFVEIEGGWWFWIGGLEEDCIDVLVLMLLHDDVSVDLVGVEEVLAGIPG